MQHKIYLILCLFFTQVSFGQTKDIWVRFYDTTTELSGYKDLNGNIKIPAKFSPFTQADTFHNIIAVTEKIDSSYMSYYLLKNGRQVGQDSVFVFDFTYDCESEEKILFKDHKKDRVGFFDKNGIIVVPAIYNAASPFYNGVAIALKNAKRKCWGGNEDTLNCEHLGWSGGETVLINDKNEVLIDSIKADYRNINWYSLKINDTNIDTTVTLVIKGNNGDNYSFIDYEKEFTKWFYSTFLPAVNSPRSNGFKEMLFSRITFWKNKKGWISLTKDNFLKAHPASITKERFQVAKLKVLSIDDEELNSLIFDDTLYKPFYTACGAYNKEKYPLFDVMLTFYKKRAKELQLTQAVKNKLDQWKLSDFDKKYEIDYQEHFEFIRTEDGYKLLRVSQRH